MSNDINKNNFYLFYFPNRNGMKDETGISNSKMCSISVVRFFSECAGLTRVTLFRAQIERFWLGFPKNAISYFIYLFYKVASFIIFPSKFFFQSENFESQIKLKISPLPRLWKRKKILNANIITKKIPKLKGLFNLGGKIKVLILVLSLERRHHRPMG